MQGGGQNSSSQSSGLGGELRDQEFAIILDTLAECQGRRKEMAEKLGISPRTLRYKLAKMRDAGIDIPG
ncbi:flagellar regulatory protein C [Vibrio cholerae]|uniref:Flagellar regulatory protein C n=1 Tax=Vibrio cholerae TaxID=666 RepID=A0A655NRJ6_VIBCL|nr:flagellar regulatory protein C [Vibrio cholerae]